MFTHIIRLMNILLAKQKQRKTLPDRSTKFLSGSRMAKMHFLFQPNCINKCFSLLRLKCVAIVKTEQGRKRRSNRKLLQNSPIIFSLDTQSHFLSHTDDAHTVPPPLPSPPAMASESDSSSSGL